MTGVVAQELNATWPKPQTRHQIDEWDPDSLTFRDSQVPQAGVIRGRQTSHLFDSSRLDRQSGHRHVGIPALVRRGYWCGPADTNSALSDHSHRLVTIASVRILPVCAQTPVIAFP